MNQQSGHLGSEHGLAPCRARLPWDTEAALYFCGHPQVHSSGNVVSAGVCHVCLYQHQPVPKTLRPYPTLGCHERCGPCMYLGDVLREESCTTCRGDVRVKVYACDHEQHDSTTLRECALCLDYERRLEVGGVRRWAVGITTARRDNPTLPETLESVQRAGWSDICVFAEPDAPVPSGITQLVRRSAPTGAWRNWLMALLDLYLNQPDADAYMLLQDDVVMCLHLREYLETVLWPQTRVGVVSIYNATTSMGAETGFQQVPGMGGFVGALTYIFPPSAVRSLFRDGPLLAHHLRPGSSGTSGIDVVIGEWSRRRSMPGLFHVPSLAQHTGETSTIWGTRVMEEGRRASSFVGREFDARRLVQASDTPGSQPLGNRPSAPECATANQPVSVDKGFHV